MPAAMIAVVAALIVAGGPGAQPDNPLNQLVEWVENGKAPKSLNGVIRDPSTGAVTATRPICMYPKVAVYNGSGPTTQFHVPPRQ